MKRETPPGTYVAPAAAQDFLFVNLGRIENLIEDNVDESYQAIAAKESGLYPGFRYARVTMDGYVAQASIGHLFRAALGAISESGTVDPFTHNFTARTSQGPAYSLVNFDNTQASAWAVTNARCQSLTLKYAEAKGMFSFNAVFLGKYQASQSKPTATYDNLVTAPHYIPYQNALTLNGAADGRLIAMTLKIDNECEPLFGATGNQDPVDISQGRITTVGLDAIFEVVDLTDINFFYNNTQPIWSAVFTNTASHTLTIQMSKLAFSNGSGIMQDKPYIRAVMKAKGLHNATDSGPVKFILLNNIATSAY